MKFLEFIERKNTSLSPDAKKLVDELSAQLDALVVNYREVFADGKISVSEVWSLGTAVLMSFMSSTIGTYDNTVKREAAMVLLAYVYDDIIAPLDIPRIPNILENTVVDPALRTMFLNTLEGVLTPLLAKFYGPASLTTGAALPLFPVR